MMTTPKPYWCVNCHFETLDIAKMREHVCNQHRREALFDNPNRPFTVLLIRSVLHLYNTTSTANSVKP
jgi:hypothetical protein